MVAFFLGKKWNESKAREWYVPPAGRWLVVTTSTHDLSPARQADLPSPLLRRSTCRWSTFDPKFSSQFRAMSPLPSQPLVSNTPSTYLHYLTGRRHLLSLHCILNLLPRHNLVQLVQDLVWGVVDPVNETGDELVLDFTLGEAGKGQQGEGVGVWGVVGKSGVLGKIRKERWDVVSPRLFLCFFLAGPSLIAGIPTFLLPGQRPRPLPRRWTTPRSPGLICSSPNPPIRRITS